MCLKGFGVVFLDYGYISTGVFLRTGLFNGRVVHCCIRWVNMDASLELVVLCDTVDEGWTVVLDSLPCAQVEGYSGVCDMRVPGSFNAGEECTEVGKVSMINKCYLD